MSTAAPPIIVTWLAYCYRPLLCITTGAFLVSKLSLTEIYAPKAALFFINSTLEADDSPPVNSLTLLSKKGVISAPATFYASASASAVSIAFLIS